jgi:chondroitin AC lyase
MGLVGTAGATKSTDLVLERLQTELAQSSNPSQAVDWLALQRKDGSWPDIDYTDRSDGRWKPTVHMDRVRIIAVAYARPGHALYRSTAAQAAVISALGAWFERKPTSTNWWHNTIGPQLALMPVLVLMAGVLPPDVKREAVAMLHDPQMVPKGQATGQNLVWYATQQLVRGAVLGDADDMARASRQLQAEVVIGAREGIQADHSFHQHGAQLYTGGYGLGFLMDSVRMAGLLRDTPWAYKPVRLDLLAAFALDGVRPLVRGRWLDWSARGREFTRVQQRQSRPQAVLPSVRALAGLGGPRREELAAFAAYIEQGGSGPPVPGNRHFWRSDFMVHQAPRGYASVRMMSARTVGTESGNGENLRGYWLPFGTTYLLRRGDEYDGLPPVWDWSRLPGVTAPAEVPSFSGLQRDGEVFVGGVSDGNAGLAAMVFKRVDTTARKAWFFHGDLMVALGCDIRSQRPAAVATTINQTRWTTDVATNAGVLKGPGTPALAPDVDWVWHDGITYVLPGRSAARLKLHEAQGNGRAINAELGGDEVRAKVFALTLEHGVQPAGAEYVYGVWMGADTPDAAHRHPRATVLANTALQQSVRHDGGAVVQAVLYQPGSLALDAMHVLDIDQPCLVQATRPGKGWRVTVSDPTQKLGRLTLVLRRGGEERSRAVATLPGALSAGSSVAVEMAA